MIPPSSTQRIDCMLSAVRLFSDRTLRTSKCGKNKKKNKTKKGTPGVVCHLCSRRILVSNVIYYDQGARQHGIYLFKCSQEATCC